MTSCFFTVGYFFVKKLLFNTLIISATIWICKFFERRGSVEYICTTNDTIYYKLQNTPEISKDFSVKYMAKFNNIVIIEADSLDLVKSSGYFTVIEKSKKLKIAKESRNFQVVTDIDYKPLIGSQSYGWQVKIGIIDSGVSSTRCSKLTESYDFTGYDNVIENAHGTIVAKIIENYARGALLTSLKVAHFGEDVTSGNIIQSIDKAIDLDLNILNISLEMLMEDEEGNECSGNCILCKYIDSAVEAADMVIVCSAGNEGKEGLDTISCPGRSRKAITVGATDIRKKLWESSSKGTEEILKPNILAPGFVKIVVGNEIEVTNGTSFAAPIITGIIAAVYHNLGKDRAINFLYHTCEDLGYNIYEQGYGLVNLKKFTEVAFNDGVHDSGT